MRECVYVCICVGICMWMHLPKETRRGDQISWTWSYGQLRNHPLFLFFWGFHAEGVAGHLPSILPNSCIEHKLNSQLMVSNFFSFNCQLNMACSSQRREFQWRGFQNRLAMGMNMGNYLIINIESPTPLCKTPFPGQVCLSYIRRLAKHASAREPMSCVPPWFLLPVPVWVPDIPLEWTVKLK